MSDYLPYIVAASVATILTRFLPFWLFKEKTTSATLAFLQRNCGLLIMVVLTIYAIKTMLPAEFSSTKSLLLVGALFLCLAVSFAVHARFRNSLLSIALPTITYMVLIRLI